MRIRTMAALGFATASVAAGLAVGGAAYAAGTGPGAEPVYQIVQDDRSSPAAQYAPEDCPERGGAGSGAEGETAAPQESL